MRRPRLLRIVRVRLRRAGGPSLVKPARASLGAFRSLSLHLDQVRQLQVVEEEIEELFLGEGEGEFVLALAVRAALAAAAAAAALGLRDLVADLVLLVARQHVVAQPVLRPRPNEGSRRLLERMVTFSAPSASETLRDLSESSIASRISALARRRKRWRLPRLLDFGLRRRSTICISLPVKWLQPRTLHGKDAGETSSRRAASG